jgi:hypothetical protein
MVRYRVYYTLPGLYMTQGRGKFSANHPQKSQIYQPHRLFSREHCIVASRTNLLAGVI